MSNSVEQIKQRLSILDVVGSYIKLTKAGKNYKAKSPFTSEKTPSFFVSPDRDMYYCFSSGKGGDIFTFVQEMEGVDFKGALRVLAERAGVELTPYRREDSDLRDRLFALLEQTTSFYEQELKKNKQAERYLADRGFTKETLKRWRLGYAPGPPAAGWRDTLGALTSFGYREEEIEKAGMIKPSDKGGGYYDRFRSRIMFPLADSSGRIIAFSGRIMPGAGTVGSEEPAKYINSPDTLLYNKSDVLYGYDRAKYSIRKFDFSILVEGQMDLLLSHQAGYTNTVAVSGSAVTERQLTLLNRLSSNLVLAFDADTSGAASAGRTAELALSVGMNVKVAVLPPSVDPADLVKKGEEEWKSVVRAATHIVDFYLAHLRSTAKDARSYRLLVSKTALPFVARIQNHIDQAHFVGRIAEALGIDEAPVWEELKKVAVSPSKEAEVMALKKADTFDNLTERRLTAILLWQKQNNLEDIDIEEVEASFKRIVGATRYEMLTEQAKSISSELLFEVENLYGEEPTTLVRTDVADMLTTLKRNHLVENRNDILAALKSAEQSHNAKKVEHLTKRYARLTSDLEALSLAGSEMT